MFKAITETKKGKKLGRNPSRDVPSENHLSHPRGRATQATPGKKTSWYRLRGRQWKTAGVVLSFSGCLILDHAVLEIPVVRCCAQCV